ncbi:MAG: protein kinase, partial [Planctomycetota bacterium]|nr:protein kinase [Planctomycetota bacterium]
EVAIKVLPDELAADEERLRRFEREARTLASLSHANLAHVYGIDQVGDICFIAMELVPGEDLATRLARGALPLGEALDVCCQIAEGLEAAHEAGVIHRDLKPANVLITPEGKVKVIDFGLAKPVGTVGEAGSTTDSVLTTEEGRLLGTPTYMAPEQARGKPIDKRVDVWAFGCVLFECLTGRRAFDGETMSDVLAAVLEKEPDLSALPRSTSAVLRDILGRCLRKDPRRRMRDVGDVRLLLEDAAQASPPGPSSTTEDARRYHMLAMSLGALALVVAVAALSGLFDAAGDPPTARATRWSQELPSGAELGWRGTSTNLSKLGRGSPLLAISDDGSRIAYCVDRGDGSEIHVLDLGAEFTSRPIEGTEDARAPFLSSDGEWLGFFASEWLQIVSVDGGGAAQKVRGFSSPNFAACWTPDDDFIVFTNNAGLFRIRPNGEDLEPLGSPRRDQGEVEYSSPSVLPDGEGVLFTVSTGTGSHVALLDLDTRERSVVVREGTSAHLLPDGRFVYAQGGGIRLLAFDPTAGGVAPVSEPVQGDVFTTASPGGCVLTNYALSGDGTLVYAPGVAEPPRSIVYWVDRQGVAEEIEGGRGFWEHPRLSPDGLRFACDRLDDRGVKDVFLYDFERGTFDRLTQDGTSIMSSWSPDGDVTVRSTNLQNRVRKISIFDKSVAEIPSIPGDDVDTALFADCWSSDGKILFLTRKGTGGRSIWAYTVGDDAPVQLVGAEKDARFGAISPDGKWLAYTATEQEQSEVFVRPYPALIPRVRVSIGGGAEPLWSEDGTSLYYRRGAAMVSVTVETKPDFRPATPVELFSEANEYDWEPGGHQHYDVDWREDRFLMIEHQGSAPDSIHVVLNWMDELTGQR